MTAGASSSRPEPFSAFTTPEFWDDPHISRHLLGAHLDPEFPLASRPHAFIDRSVEWIAGVLRLAAGSRVLDLGCGPGLYAVRLARRGIEVDGVDASRRSVAHAKQSADEESLPARFRHANYLRDDLGRGYDAALLVFEDYCALSPAQRSGLLARVRTSLEPGGRLLFDVTAAPRFAECADAVAEEVDLDGGFWAESPYLGRHETWTYPELRLVLNRYSIRKDDTTREFWNWMHCLTADEVSGELQAAGLAAPDLYGDVAGAPYREDATTFAVVTHPVVTGG